MAARLVGGEVARFDSWPGAIWTVVIAFDFFWLSNPTVVQPFKDSLHDACIATAIAVVATLPRVRLPRLSWAVLVVLAFGLGSALWSTDVESTVGFTTTFALIALIAAVVSSNADARTICHGMVLGGVLVLAASWYALHEDLPYADVPPGTIGYLAGIGGNRNILAYTMLLSLTFAICSPPRRWWARLIWLLATSAIAVGAYLTQSGTGYAATLVLVAAGIALSVADARGPRVRSAGRRWSMRVAALLSVVGCAAGVELLGRALGRDTTTLTGRVPLWEAIWSSTTGVDRWFGAGWGAVWPHSWNPAPRSPIYLEIVERNGYILYHGHSSVFDLLPEVGLVGVAIYALTYVQALVRAYRLRDPRQSPTAARLLAARATLLGVLALLLFGVTEPMSTIPLGWFTIVVLATGLVPTPARSVGRRHRRQP